MSPSVTLFCRAFLQADLHFSDYKLLAEWLGSYSYVIPVTDRLQVTAPLSTELLAFYSGDLNKAWWAAKVIETSFNWKQQEEILKWTLDYKNYLTPQD